MSPPPAGGCAISHEGMQQEQRVADWGMIMALPCGTLTFLFTDIEGSTRLWEQQPAEMQVALSHHDEVLRGSIQSHSGHVFKAAGDGFCAVFSRATEAIACALEAQRSLLPLADHPTAPIRVRMALTTGDAELRDDDYFGACLNRCARVLSAAHGGQVLIAASTASVAGEDLPAAATLQPLGKHRLRDLTAPEELFQLCHADLPTDFPPLRSLERFQHNLPVTTTRLIDREADLQEVSERLTAARLLTLTGTGGAGKTRLALQVASDVLEEWPDGVWFVDLASLAESSFVERAVLSAVGIHAEPRRAPRDVLLEALRSRRLLLLLDNCEHLIEVCAEMAEAVLMSCPHVAILATSREPLRITGEVVWSVPPLPFPEEAGEPLSPEGLSQYAAVQLFVERAAAVRPGFVVTSDNVPAVAQICWRLDGIPLAIELAAARARALSAHEIARHLDDRFHVLTRGHRDAPPRHQTLRAAVDWSHELMSERERALFRRLSVFAGWFSLEAAEAIAGGASVDPGEVLDILDELVAKSLVLFGDGDEDARYRMLATLQAYANERLIEAGEEATTRERHAHYFLTLAESAVDDDSFASEHVRHSARHYSDLRAALEWFTEADDGLDAGVRLAGALAAYWRAAGLYTEGRTHVARLLARPDARAGTPIRAGALETGASLAFGQEDVAAARGLEEEALRLRRDLGDEEGVVLDLFLAGALARMDGDQTAARSYCEQHLTWQRQHGDAVGTAESLGELAWQFHYEGEHGRAEELIGEAFALIDELASDARVDTARRGLLHELAQVRQDFETLRLMAEEDLATARSDGDERAIRTALRGLRYAAHGQGDYAVARRYQDECVAISRRLGDTGGIALDLRGLGWVAHDQGEYEQARVAFEEALEIYRAMGNNPRTAGTLMDLARVARAQGDEDTARAYDEANLAVWRESGDMPGLGDALGRLGNAAWLRGDHAEALARHTQRLTVWRESGDEREIACALIDIGGANWGLGESAEAQHVLEQSIAIWDRLGDSAERAQALGLLGLAFSDQGDHQRARSVLDEALAVSRELGDRPRTAYTLSHLGLVAWREGSDDEARRLQLESLAIWEQETAWRRFYGCLERLGAVYSSTGDPARAARLFGAADALREEFGSPNRADAFAEHEQVLSTIRYALGDAAFDEAWAEGRAMDTKQALAYALDRSGPL